MGSFSYGHASLSLIWFVGHGAYYEGNPREGTMRHVELTSDCQINSWFTDDGIAFLCLIFSHDSVSSGTLFSLWLVILWSYFLCYLHCWPTIIFLFLHSSTLFFLYLFILIIFLFFEECWDKSERNFCFFTNRFILMPFLNSDSPPPLNYFCILWTLVERWDMFWFLMDVCCLTAHQLILCSFEPPRYKLFFLF